MFEMLQEVNRVSDDADDDNLLRKMKLWEKQVCT